MKKYHLYGARYCGSAIAELFLANADISYSLTQSTWAERKKWKKLFGKYNPLAQVPTLVIDRKHVLTETLAIAIHCNERGGTLIPEGKNADDFWRWTIFIIANIYPSFTYKDNATEYVSAKRSQEELAKRILHKRKTLWKQLEREVKGPWFLGSKATAIDAYISVMIYWTPGIKWFKKQCPKLHRIAMNFAKRKKEGPVLKRHFAE